MPPKPARDMQNKEMPPKKILPFYRTVRCHIPSERRKGKNAKFSLCIGIGECEGITPMIFTLERDAGE